MFECVTLSDEAFDFWCEVGVVYFPVAFWNVVFVSILDYCVEFFYGSVYVCDWCIVKCFKMLFCFSCEGFPVGFFVVCVGVSEASRGGSCLCGDDDWEVV